MCTDELIPAPEIKTFYYMLPSANESSATESNSMLWLLYLYLSRATFLVSFIDPNKQLPNTKYEFKFLNCRLGLLEIYIYIYIYIYYLFRDLNIIY